MTPRTAIALSGGVDSLVSAHLLKKTYVNLIGIHFTTGFETGSSDVSSLEDQLGIQIHTVDLSKAFRKQVVDYFISTYLKGKTPNPCLICNRRIKFGSLMSAAEALGAKRIATGHYAGILRDKNGNAFLVKGLDPVKEQSYFLALLDQAQLDRIEFPLARMTKEDVRQIAREKGLVPLEKKESQDICFMANQSVEAFIRQETGIIPAPGDIVTTDGRIIGTHDGLFKFTIGQRRGINCPGPKPYYVIALDVENNRLVIGFKEELKKQTLSVNRLRFQGQPPESPITVTTKIRYSHPGATSRLDIKGAMATVTFDEPQNAVTPGQAAVFYLEDRVVGAGIIQ